MQGGVEAMSVQLGHGSIEYGRHPPPWYKPPVTKPCWTQYSQAEAGKPPAQPSPHESQQVRRSSAEISSVNCPSEAIQILSDMASAHPKAQQLPQLL